MNFTESTGVLLVDSVVTHLLRVAYRTFVEGEELNKTETQHKSNTKNADDIHKSLCNDLGVQRGTHFVAT